MLYRWKTQLKKKVVFAKNSSSFEKGPQTFSLYPYSTLSPNIHRIEPGLPAGIAGPMVWAPAPSKQLHTQTSSASLGSCSPAPKHSPSGVPTLETSRHGQASCCQDLGRRRSLTELSRLLLGPQFVPPTPPRKPSSVSQVILSVLCVIQPLFDAGYRTQPKTNQGMCDLSSATPPKNPGGRCSDLFLLFSVWG